MSRDDETTRVTRRESQSINWRGIALWIGGIAPPIAMGIAVWAHGVLWGHDNRLTTLEVQRQSSQQEMQQHQERDVRAQSEVRETLRRLEDKLDRLTERTKP